MPDNKPPLLLDNRRANVGDFLASRLNGASRFRLATAYFSVYGHDALANQLGDKSPPTQFLFGAPELVGNINAGDQPARPFNLSEEGLEFATGDPLNQSPLAKRCAKWVKQSVEIRRLKKGKGFLHGKMYHIASDAGDAAVVGSSNFTRRGLGMSNNPNLELNLVADSPAARDELARWFDGIWNDGELTEDIKEKVLTELRKYFCDYSPEFVYYKTLFEFFNSRPGGLESPELETSHLYNSEIWKKLYDFQQHGAKAAIAKLGLCGGCILADSVGLGKTYTALAVIKYFELLNKNVLVLCPKKLENNWRRYSAFAADDSNPFENDRFGYRLLAHTDLLREEGMANGINLAKFKWSNYDLIVIDESHNFRNQSKSRRDEGGGTVRRGRYEKLMRAIQKGAKTKVLMLSATPVNNSLRDLHNQIRLVIGESDGAFGESLAVASVKNTLKVAQEKFQKWADGVEKGKAELLQSLGDDFFRLLGGVTIARSRGQIKKFYQDKNRPGKFPRREEPQNFYPTSDSQGELSYEQLRGDIEKAKFHIYRPSDYALPVAQKRLDDEKERLHFNQQSREGLLVRMMRINFLKRLESGVCALRKTLERTIDKIDAQTLKIDDYLQTRKDGIVDSGQIVGEADSEDEELAAAWESFVVNRKAASPYHLSELKVEEWRADMQKDRVALQSALDRVVKITPKRDNKLLQLMEILRDKAAGENRKLLVFTAFKDTADYLHDNLEDLAAELNLKMAMVSGDAVHAPAGSGVKSEYNAILDAFAPCARECENPAAEIDLLIATDCISEGQNLQDCDTVLNYDIHWNPVRLIQRFGRIDRIGSVNPSVRMINFWPPEKMEEYLALEKRVRERMALVDVAASGEDNLLAAAPADDNDPLPPEPVREQMELTFRHSQLQEMMDGRIPDLDDQPGAVSMSELTMDYFHDQLMRYLGDNRKNLEDAPLGIHAVVASAADDAPPGAIFVLRPRRKEGEADKSVGEPFYFVQTDGSGVRQGRASSRTVLRLFDRLASEEKAHKSGLCNAFNLQIEKSDSDSANFYHDMAKAAAAHVRAQIDIENRGNITPGASGGGLLSKKSDRAAAKDFELVAWLVILDAEDGGKDKGGGGGILSHSHPPAKSGHLLK